eukprot:1158316-Pelagomonas_calceolata.AAC.5
MDVKQDVGKQVLKGRNLTGPSCDSVGVKRNERDGMIIQRAGGRSTDVLGIYRQQRSILHADQECRQAMYTLESASRSNKKEGSEEPQAVTSHKTHKRCKATFFNSKSPASYAGSNLFLEAPASHAGFKL